MKNNIVTKGIKFLLNSDYRSMIKANYGAYDSMNDKEFLEKMFKVYMGYELDLNNPKTFNEKLQWLKLYDRDPMYTTMVDKYSAKFYVASIIGQQYIIPTLGVWDKFEDIDFDELPNQFVLKCTHDCGGLVICRDKSKLNIKKAKRKINRSLNRNYYLSGREWPYKNVKPRVIAEKFMQDGIEIELKDYKFYCFNGEPKFLYLSQGLENHSTAHISFVNLDRTFAPFGRSDYMAFKELPCKPKNFELMIVIAKKLSKGIPFLRVDLYEINERVYFGELTFSPVSGFMPFEPPEADEKVGDLLILPNN